MLVESGHGQIFTSLPSLTTGSGVAKEGLVEKYPKLKPLKEHVLALPAIEAWVEKRPESQM